MKAPDSKSGLGETLTWVRIPPLPPYPFPRLFEDFRFKKGGNRYTVFRRGAVFYYEDQTTGQQKSLLTRDEAEARRIVQAKNDAVKLPQMNLVMAKTYLSAQDPKMITRTWADVMVRFCDRKNDKAQKEFKGLDVNSSQHSAITKFIPRHFSAG